MEAPSAEDRVFELLRREDKCYLGSGDGLIFAPPLPLWLERPGCWDGVHYFLFGFQPGYTFALVDAAGRELPLALRSRQWTPAELDLRYAAGTLELREQRLVLPGGRVVSECTITNRGELPAQLTDIAGPDHLCGLYQHLFDESSFWLPWPVPSTAATGPTFSPAAEWQGVRQGCTWNGRVWPMTNSHLVEALAHASLALDPALRTRTVELLGRYLRMLCFDGDPARPNSFEHYSPFTGQPSLYRGLDDYQHSWINDLIIRLVAGFRPTDAGFVVDPFPFDISRLRLERLPFRGHRVGTELTDRMVRALVGGRVFESERGEPLAVGLRP